MPVSKPGHTLQANAFDADYLFELQKQIRSSRYFAVNNLNLDFVGTRGFSVAVSGGPSRTWNHLCPSAPLPIWAEEQCRQAIADERTSQAPNQA
tara:strand:+ start:222 stop:503 length:282 start_codon:yes stop_codon:yes gene_type:complete